ncbi:MAG: phage tail domain-containing protein, partial [Candidatus Coproplasma sp.]
MFDLKLENANANVVNINDGVKYQVLGCSGLTPPSASIYTGKSPNRKGVKYNGSTLNERNIVVQIKILGDIEKNRNALYEWIDTEQYCKVYYRNGEKNVYCEGHIQDCDADFFVDNEIISVAILCENPYWKDLQTISAGISALLKQFTFPFAIDSAGIPFSTMRDNNTTTIVNSG